MKKSEYYKMFERVNELEKHNEEMIDLLSHIQDYYGHVATDKIDDKIDEILKER